MPLVNQLHVDSLLGNLSVKYRNVEYIADQVFPFVPVKKSSDLYRIYARNFRLPDTLRSAKGEAREWSFDVSTASYNLAQHSLVDYVSDRDADNYDIGDLRADATEELSDKILLRMEKSVADLFQTTTSWSQNVSLSAAQKWTLDTVTSNPIPQFDTAATVILENSGQRPNVAIIPHRNMIAAKNHMSVLDRIKYTSADITANMLAGLFSIPKILVPTAVIDSSFLGLTESVAPVWGDAIFVGYVAPSPSPMKPSAGYIFRNQLPLVKRWREEKRQSEAIEVNVMYDAKIVSSLSGYLMTDALS